MEMKTYEEPATEQSAMNMLKDYTTTITILEHLSDAIFILDPHGKIEYANKVAIELLNLKLESIIGRNLDDFLSLELDVHKLRQDGTNEILIKTIYEGDFNEIETALLNGTKQTPVMISFGLVQNSKGEVNYIIASAKDITVRKALEKELQHQQLLDLSRDRYKELGELAINMVHNFSQPITSIHLMVELTQKLIKKPQIDVEAITKNLNDIVNLLNIVSTSISNVRNFAYLAEDDGLKAIDIRQSIESAHKQLSYELTEKAIQLETVAERVPPILASPVHMQQVFVTLLKYIIMAYDKMHQALQVTGGLNKKIEIGISSYKAKWINVSLSDNMFFPEDESAADLTEFYTESELEAVNKGLDLAMVKLVLTSLGGDLKVNRKDTGGVEFIIRLPIDQKDEREELLNLIELLHHDDR